MIRNLKAQIVQEVQQLQDADEKQQSIQCAAQLQLKKYQTTLCLIKLISSQKYMTPSNFSQL
ncbi:unnamed protein product [Paramecium sonneborni]|uniref:Uncharacterized protein n=1 Tax=Paramecium sonneborni TaxID=65129 RepID=A0A8S1RFP0_9CILI|nr:unnamed protein product [Paramecium sonneborni]